MTFSPYAMGVNYNESQQQLSSFMYGICQKAILRFQLIMVFLDYFIKIRKYIYFTIEINNSGYYMCHFHVAYVMLYNQFCLCWCRTLWTNSSVNFSVRPNPRKQHRIYHRGTTHLIFQLSIHVLKKKDQAS